MLAFSRYTRQPLDQTRSDQNEDVMTLKYLPTAIVRVLLLGSLAAVALPAVAHAASAVEQSARGGAVALGQTQLPADLKAALQAKVAEWRRLQPKSFAAVAAVTGCTSEGYQMYRRPDPECSRALRALGPAVTLPLLSALVLEAPKRADGSLPYSTEREQLAYAAGALQAVGTFRQADAAPVLRFLASHGASALAKDAAEALGRTATAETPAEAARSLTVLTTLANADGPRQLAAISGLGQARGLAAANALATGLDNATATTASAWAWALGQNASSWAWDARRHGAAANAHESVAVRELAAKTLVRAFVRHNNPEIREAAMKGLMLAAHPASLALVADARAMATPNQQVALDGLAKRLQRYFARNAAAKR